MKFKYQIKVDMGKDASGQTVYQWAVGNTDAQFVNTIGRLYVQREGYIAPETAITPKIIIPTFNEFSEQWYNTFVSQKQPNTQRSYRSLLKIWQKAFGNTLISAITPMDVQQVLVQRGDMKKPSQTNALNILKQVLDVALEEGLVSRNVANSRYVSLTGKDSEERRVLTDEELAHCISKLDEIEDRDTKLNAAISIYTGMRPGEVLGLKWDDIDFEKSVIHIRRAVASHGQEGVICSTKTKNGLRDVGLTPQLASILKPYRGIGLIFTRGGMPYSQHDRELLVAEVEKVMDIGHLVPYTFRHTFATKAYESGSKLEPLSKWMGHSEEATTIKFYVHNTEKMTKETEEIVNAQFEKLAGSCKN